MTNIPDTTQSDSDQIEIRTEVQLVAVADLVPDKSNPRTHNEKNLEATTESIRQFGWTHPLVVQRGTNVVLGGNLRLDVAKQLGLEQVPVTFVDFDQLEQEGYKLAENRTAELARWDWQVVADKVGMLEPVDPELLIGWSQAEVDALGSGDFVPPPDLIEVAPKKPEIVEDEVPDKEQVEPRTNRGDLWVLGDHRLFCGDATDQFDVERLLDGAVPMIMVTDPPYGLNYDPEWRDQIWTV